MTVIILYFLSVTNNLPNSLIESSFCFSVIGNSRIEWQPVIYKSDAKEGYLVVEHGKQTNLTAMDNFEFCRNFGNVYFSFFKA